MGAGDWREIVPGCQNSFLGPRKLNKRSRLLARKYKITKDNVLLLYLIHQESLSKQLVHPAINSSRPCLLEEFCGFTLHLRKIKRRQRQRHRMLRPVDIEHLFDRRCRGPGYISGSNTATVSTGRHRHAFMRGNPVEARKILVISKFISQRRISWKSNSENIPLARRPFLYYFIADIAANHDGDMVSRQGTDLPCQEAGADAANSTISTRRRSFRIMASNP